MRILTLICGVMLSASVQAFAAPPKVTDAKDGIFAAFQTRPLVGLGDNHGLSQEMDFYAALIRDPRFAAEVGNIVLEVGGAAQQATIDRYVNGETVPYPELRRVWTDVVGWMPTVTYLGFINIYATIRDVNMTLPPDKRIKVWLGEPVIDWSKIRTWEQWREPAGKRDSHPAELIEREILAKDQKALVIYGGWHLGPWADSLRAMVEVKRPNSFFVVMPYSGHAEKACSVAFEKTIKGWKAPSLATPVAGSTLERDLMRPGCHAFAPPKGQLTEEEKKNFADNNRHFMGMNGHGLLYLGPRERLGRASSDPAVYMDMEFRAELERRVRVMSNGNGKLEGYNAERSPATTRPFWVD